MSIGVRISQEFKPKLNCNKVLQEPLTLWYEKTI